MLQDIYVTTGQAAAMLHLNRLTIQRWVNAGKLTSQRVGYVILIDRAEVERIAMERSTMARV